jgi:hypothetical protein
MASAGAIMFAPPATIDTPAIGRARRAALH